MSAAELAQRVVKLIGCERESTHLPLMIRFVAVTAVLEFAYLISSTGRDQIFCSEAKYIILKLQGTIAFMKSYKETWT